MRKLKTPKLAEELVGTTQKLGGGLFSSNKETKFKEYDILNWRWGSAMIMNTKTLEMLHPTIEFLVKNKDMKTSRWTRGFPAKDYGFTKSGSLKLLTT